MNAESNLVQAYHEWHRLADAETKAIQTRNWDFFADCQLATKDFLPLIERLTLAARPKSSPAFSPPPDRAHLRFFQDCHHRVNGAPITILVRSPSAINPQAAHTAS